MFFLRCAFWLSVVYSSMSWTNGALQARPGEASIAAAARSVSARLTDKAVASATDFCTHHAADCLADAARLTSLVAATDPANEPTSSAAADHDLVPLPVPDPRRHAGTAKLAHAS